MHVSGVSLFRESPIVFMVKPSNPCLNVTSNRETIHDNLQHDSCRLQWLSNTIPHLSPPLAILAQFQLGICEILCEWFSRRPMFHCFIEWHFLTEKSCERWLKHMTEIHIFQRNASIEWWFTMEGCKKNTCWGWASSSFSVHDDSSTNLQGSGWGGCLQFTTEVVLRMFIKVHSQFQLQHTTHLKLLYSGWFGGALFSWWILRDLEGGILCYNSHTFLVGFLGPWAPANNLNSLGLLKLILPALGFSGMWGCNRTILKSFRLGAQACKAPAEQTANKKSGAQLSICCLQVCFNDIKTYCTGARQWNWLMAYSTRPLWLEVANVTFNGNERKTKNKSIKSPSDCLRLRVVSWPNLYITQP